MRRLLAAVLACVLSVPACGVGSEDEPQIIEESTQTPPPATPSFDTEPSPPSSSSDTPTTDGSSGAPTTESSVPGSSPAPAR